MNVRNKTNSKHLYITAHIIGIKELEHEFEAFRTKWSPIVDKAVVRNYGNWGGLVDGNDVTKIDKQITPEKRYPCALLWHSSKIQPNGDISKCFISITGEKKPVGNLFKQSFEQIWHGEQFKRNSSKTFR